MKDPLKHNANNRKAVRKQTTTSPQQLPITWNPTTGRPAIVAAFEFWYEAVLFGTYEHLLEQIEQIERGTQSIQRNWTPLSGPPLFVLFVPQECVFVVLPTHVVFAGSLAFLHLKSAPPETADKSVMI